MHLLEDYRDISNQNYPDIDHDRSFLLLSMMLEESSSVSIVNTNETKSKEGMKNIVR